MTNETQKVLHAYKNQMLEAISTAQSKINSLRDKDFEAAKQQLKAGEAAPSKQITNTAALKSICSNYNEEIKRIAQTARGKLPYSEAPSEEAVRTLQLVAMRENVSKDELLELQETYGSSYQAAKLIQDIAVKHNIHLAPTDQEVARELIDDAEQTALKLIKEDRALTNSLDSFVSFTVAVTIEPAFDRYGI